MNKTVQELIDRIDNTPWGSEERELVDEAVALAAQLGDEDGEYAARMRLTVSARNSGDDIAMLGSFAWCLAKHNSDPARFPRDIGLAADLFWQFKWMAGALSGSPDFDEEQIETVLADMRSHYQREGLGMSGPLMSQFESEWYRGNLEAADRLRLELESTPQDDYSHCDACVRSQRGGFLFQTGREVEGLALLDDLVEGGYSCGDEPECALGRALLPLLRAGRLDDAKSAHMRSYRLSRTDPDKLPIVADSIVFCAVTGNEARGLSLVERHLRWLGERTLRPSDRLKSLIAFAVLLDAVTRAGHGDVPVRGSNATELEEYIGPHDGVWTASGLALATWTAAERLAAAFDSRNGNDNRARSLQAARDLAAEHYDLPLDSSTIMPAPGAVADPTDGQGWAKRARDYATLGDLERGIAAARRALETATDVDRHDAYSILLGGLIADGRGDEAAALAGERIAALRADGRGEQAALEERVGLAVFGSNEDSDLAALVRELSNPAVLAGDPAVLADVELSLGTLYWRRERLDEAAELVARAVERFRQGAVQGLASALSFRAELALARDDDDTARAAFDALLALDLSGGTRARALLGSARLHGRRGDFAVGIPQAEEAVRLIASLDVRHAALEASTIAASLLSDAGDHTASASHFRYAIRTAEDLQRNPESLMGLQFALGRQLLNAGAAAEAAEILQQVYTDETELGTAPESVAQTVFLLAKAFAAQEEYGAAASAFLRAAELAEEGGDTLGAARASLNAGQIYTRFDAFDEAITALRPALELARKTPEETSLLADVLHSLGTALAGSGDAAGLAHLDEAIALARDAGAEWYTADLTDSRARALATLERPDEAVATALTAADGYAAAGDQRGAGNAELLAGTQLAQLGRVDEAAAVLQSALDREHEVAPLRRAIALELGNALEKLGRTSEAATVRAIAESA